MAPEQQQLLQRIFSSRHFAYANALRRILQYLCEHAAGADSQPLKEYEVAVSALGRPESFDPKNDPVVRVSMASVRDRLRAYFEGEGREEPLRLAVPKGRYQALFSVREDEPAVAPTPSRPVPRALKRFWAPYATANTYNAVMYTEPLFFRDEEAGVYSRSLWVNDPATPVAEVKNRLPFRDGSTLKPCYHYLSAGEVQASISFVRLFQELGLGLDIRNARLSTLNDFRHANLILIGSIRTNHLMDSMIGSKGFVMTGDSFENPKPRAGEKQVYKGERSMDGKLPRNTDYALVMRRPGMATGSAITIIASNHGRAVQGGGTLLTLEPQLAGMLEAMGLSGDAPLPESFQLLLQVDMIDLEDEVVNVRYAGHRIF